METISLWPLLPLLTISEIPIGVGGSFDAKQFYGNWEIDWDGNGYYEDDEEKDGKDLF